MKPLLISLLAASLAHAAPISGRIISVTDGDTLSLFTVDDKLLKIRLEGIDAPELNQEAGSQSLDALAALVLNKEVTADSIRKDRYGLTLAWLRVEDVDVNRRMVANGRAWQYLAYNKDPDITRLQQDAIQKKTGLWATNHAPTPPWEFREAKQDQKFDRPTPILTLAPSLTVVPNITSNPEIPLKKDDQWTLLAPAIVGLLTLVITSIVNRINLERQFKINTDNLNRQLQHASNDKQKDRELLLQKDAYVDLLKCFNSTESVFGPGRHLPIDDHPSIMLNLNNCLEVAHLVASPLTQKCLKNTLDEWTKALDENLLNLWRNLKYSSKKLRDHRENEHTAERITQSSFESKLKRLKDNHRTADEQFVKSFNLKIQAFRNAQAELKAHFRRDLGLTME